MSSKTNSMPRTSSARSLSVAASFSSTLRSVVRSAWLRIPASVLAPPAAEYSRSATRGQLVADHLLDLLDHLRAGLAHAGDAQRDVGLLALGQAGQHLRRPASVCRLASTSAIV